MNSFQVQYLVCVPNLLSTHILTIWCIGSICCPLYKRGWVLLVCARTTQCLNSICKPYWISKLMILLVIGVSLRCGNTWQTPVYSFLGRHSPIVLGGYYI